MPLLFPAVHRVRYLTDMDKFELEILCLRLKSLTVFRELLNDSVIKALCKYLELAQTDDVLAVVTSYSEFVSRLYEANGSDLAAYINDAVNNSENVYVCAIGSGKEVNENIIRAVDEELKTLQLIADISSKALCKEIGQFTFLPEFCSGGVNIKESFIHRVNNIGKYGYGIYAKNPMFYIDCENKIVPVKNPDSISLESLVDYERERSIILDNTKALVEGKAAANILLTGDAGTGKSSTVKAVGNAFFADGLRIIEVRKEQLGSIPSILDELAVNPLKFILFIDYLAFRNDDDNFNALKAVLEGSVSAKSKNVVIYATSNRRHIVRETFSDREGDDIHRNDTMQEMVSLSERFGIHVRFHKPDKATYLNIVHHMVKEKNITVDEAQIDLLAERFALERGNRSARLAKQFVEGLDIKEGI